MAPSPEHDNEPKAPDKNDNKTSDGVELMTNSEFLDDHLSSSTRELDVQGSSVSTLDDGQLKALLDEAINYKTPKDREGKSRIFKVLLQEAEEDERNARAASASGPQLARYYNAAARRQRGAAGRRGAEASAAAHLTHGGSLQDLVQAGLYEAERVERCTGRRSGGGSSRRRHHQQHPVTGHRTVSVSARQREGGSLPSNVNAGALYPADLRLFADTPRPTANMVEACTEPSQAPLSQTSQSQSGAESPPRPEYTVIDLSNQEEAQTASAPPEPQTAPTVAPGTQPEGPVTTEENRGLLQRDSQRISYNSTAECLPRYRFPGLDNSTSNAEHQETEKEEQAMEMTANIGRRHHASAFDGVPRHQYFNPLDELHRHRIPRISYTSRATLEVDGVSGGAHASTTVDKTISFPQFEANTNNSTTGATSLQLDPDYNSVKCIVEGNGNGSDSASGSSASAGRTTSQTASVNVPLRFLSVANSKIIHGVDRFAHHTDKKGLDENGNAVTTTTTTTLDSKKKKKCKVDRNVTVLKSENLPGHRADIIERIDLLVKYIEEDDASSSKPKHHHHHHHHHHHKSLNAEKSGGSSLAMESSGSKKRPRVKTKSEQHGGGRPAVVKKSNSLEEISKTKLEDLVAEDGKVGVRSRVKKQSTSEDGDRRSWGDMPPLEGVQSATVPAETAEFHVVTKKKKSKKRGATKPATTTYYHYHRMEHGGAVSAVAPAPSVCAGGARRERPEPQRRKSACSVPPSDKSVDSSDVDSVHSLPAAPAHRRDETVGSGAHQASPASTSYADIARTNGGGGQTSSSASSNCSSHSSSSSSHSNNQAPPSAWKLSPQPVLPPYSPVGPQHPPPALRSEHFPELCTDKDPPMTTTTHQTFSNDFPMLGGDAPTITPIPRVAPTRSTPTLTKVIRRSGGGGSSRPAVIILDDGHNGDASLPPNNGPIQVSGLTFGFALNEQLLNDNSDAAADCLCLSPPPAPTPPTPRLLSAAVDMFAQRFLVPPAAAQHTHTYNHDKIVTYVGLAWEDVVHQTNGKVQYYNGQ